MFANPTNQVHTEGYLYSMTNPNGKNLLQVRRSKAGMTYISGDICILTDTKLMNIVDVHYQYVPQTFKSGNENGIFTELNNLINSARTYEEVGERATLVRVDSNYEVNDWYNRDGVLQSTGRIRGGFIHQTTADQVQFGATFSIDVLISNMVEREVENGTPYLELRAYAWNYRNDILPITLTCHSKNGIAYIEDAEPSSKNPMLTKVIGSIVSRTETKMVDDDMSEVAFGEPTQHAVQSRISYWDITTMNTPREFDDESTLTRTELKAQLQAREDAIAEQKRRDDEYHAQRAANTSPAYETKQANVSASEDEEDDFPF